MAFLRQAAKRTLTPLVRRSSPSIRPHSRPCIRSFTTSPASTSTPGSSVSADEVSHFNGLASSWWDPHGPSRLLHLMNPLRHDFINRCHDTYPPLDPSASSEKKLTYLDIGCGGGIFAESAARLQNAESVTAIDPTPGVLAIAKSHAKRDPALATKLQYLQTPIEGLSKFQASSATQPPTDTSPLPVPKEFDIVSVFEVIEHVNTPSQFLDTVTPFVAPGGWLIMSTIARTWASWLTTIVIAQDIVGIVPPGTHDWDKYVNHGELEEYFVRAGGWAQPVFEGVVYVPGIGWRRVEGSERVGNYFLGVRREM
jgi:polyprenyldihydroxybenzoate methyltransferase/3-demethylubiquinol 3-O-methyltransferase